MRFQQKYEISKLLKNKINIYLTHFLYHKVYITDTDGVSKSM